MNTNHVATQRASQTPAALTNSAATKSTSNPMELLETMTACGAGNNFSADRREEESNNEDRITSPHDDIRENVAGEKVEQQQKIGNDINLANFWSWFDPGFTTSTTTPEKKDNLGAEIDRKLERDAKVQMVSSPTAFWNAVVALIDPAVEPSSTKDDVNEQLTDQSVVPEEESVDDSRLFDKDLKSLPSEDGDDHVPEPTITTEDIRDDNGKGEDESATMKLLDVHSTASTKTHVSNLSNVNLKVVKSKEGTETVGSTVATNRTEAVKDMTAHAERTLARQETIAPQSKDTLETRRDLLIKELREAVAIHGRYDVKCANISAALGDVLHESGQDEEAIKLHRDAITIYSCKLGDDHPTTTNAKIRLGLVQEEAGQYDEAITSFYLATSMRRSTLGEQDPLVGDGFKLMANSLRKKGDCIQAIKELKRALKIYREALGDSHEKVSATVDEIASLYVLVGDFGKSSAILEEVVKLKAATLGTRHAAVAETLCTLATTYECGNHLEKAMKSLKKAYKIYTENGGFSSGDAATVLNRMARLYEAMGDHQRAAIAYLGVLRGRKQIHGSENLIVSETYYDLGRTLRQTGQLDKALKCMKEALPVFVTHASAVDEAVMIAEIMREMALIYKDKKNYADAAKIFKQELGVRRKLGQPDFPIIARTLNHLGVAEYENGNHTRALRYLVEALTIFQGQGEESIDCAEVLFNTGLVFEAVKNNQRAIEAFTEASRIFRSHGYAMDHPHLSKANTKIEKLAQGKATSKAGKKSGSPRKRLFR